MSCMLTSEAHSTINFLQAGIYKLTGVTIVTFQSNPSATAKMCLNFNVLNFAGSLVRPRQYTFTKHDILLK